MCVWSLDSSAGRWEKLKKMWRYHLSLREKQHLSYRETHTHTESFSKLKSTLKLWLLLPACQSVTFP